MLSIRDIRLAHGSPSPMVPAMTAAENKNLMQAVFSELSAGNTKPFRDAMADDFCWTITGTTAWSGAYRGKQAVLSELIEPLLAQFADRYTNTAERLIA